jgi:hypothetical protein
MKPKSRSPNQLLGFKVTGTEAKSIHKSGANEIMFICSLILYSSVVTIRAICFNAGKRNLYCDHKVHLCVSYDSQKKAMNIFLQSINQLVFVMDTQCVVCEVGN